MKTKLLSLFASLLLGSILVASAKEEVFTVAVFNFDSPDESIKDLGPKVATLINATLSADPQLVTVERAELDRLLGELEHGLSGTVSTETAAKVGHLTGAKVLVTGKVFKVDRDLVIVAKIIGTETSRVYGELVKGRSPDAITDMASELSRKISQSIAEKGATLLAKVESREDRIARLKKKVKDEKLPLVSVRIGEQHFGQAVRDPAAETELSVILTECGFTVVDEKSKEQPEVEITGEAFSSLGMRKGNLVSCKARVEIKVHDLDKRKLLLQDRQTSVGIDVAELTAAKTALQNAAMDLAERLLPKLVK